MKGLWPALLTALAWMVFAALMLPHVKGSPDACIITHPACHTNAQFTWVAVLMLIIPFLILNVLGTSRKGGS